MSSVPRSHLFTSAKFPDLLIAKKQLLKFLNNKFGVFAQKMGILSVAMELESEFHYIYLNRFRYKNLATGFNVFLLEQQN